MAAVNDDHAEMIEKSFQENGITKSVPIDPSTVQITEEHYQLFREVAIELDKTFIKKCGLNLKSEISKKDIKFILNEKDIHLESGNFQPDESNNPKQYRTTTFVGIEGSEIKGARESIHMAVIALNSIFNEIRFKHHTTNIIVFKRFTFVSVDKIPKTGNIMFLVHYGIIHS